MKKHFLLLFALLALVACTEKQPEECYVPKSTVEFAGNAFSAFSLGGDIRFFLTPNPENNSQWAIQAFVPVRKEANMQFKSLDMDITPLDERNLRIRDGFTLVGEDLPNLLPVYNSAEGVEKTIMFSIPADGKRDFSKKEALDLLQKIKGARMSFNVLDPETPAEVPVEVAAADEKKEPVTLNSLCVQNGVYGLLARYESALKNKDKKGAKKIEDQLWAIEKRVGNDTSIPKSLRDRFKDYIEDREDEIEDKY